MYAARHTRTRCISVKGDQMAVLDNILGKLGLLVIKGKVDDSEQGTPDTREFGSQCVKPLLN